MGRAQLLLTQVEEPRYQRQLRIIETAAQDGARTVRRIQEFTRVRRARPFEPVDVGQLIDEVLEVTRSRWKDDAMARGIAYEMRVSGGPVPPVAGDPSELREVLVNLVFNALDAMPKGGRVTIRLGADDERVRCDVTDTGVGMTDDVRRRVFDPFFTTKAEKGTGLGLSVAYGIIARHGGGIEARGEPGRGSTFTIRLPVARAPAPAPAPSAPGPAPRAARILLIDDEPAVRDVLADVLAAQGHTVSALPDGRAGLARLRDEPFDLVVTDLGMPELSGWEVVRLARLERGGIPVVLVTGWADHIDQEEARAHGVNGVLTKPFEVDAVREVVARALGGAST
jgi:CheY-like chemotaxis protein